VAPATAPGRSGAWLSLDLPAAASSVDAARRAVLAHVDGGSLDARAVFDLELVLEELMMNIVMHAWPDPAGRRIALAARRDGDAVELRLEDDGTPFDPVSAAERPRAATLDEARPGGLGLPLLRRRVRAMHYERRDGLNRLTLRVGGASAA
jgi:anti-sigma regulatory factor (Ser/Thr protein kinase)